MQSSATTVDEYLAEQPDGPREALAGLRELCLAELPGFTEVMAHGMPTYRRNGVGEIAFAAQKRYISFYLLRTDVRAAHAEELAGHDMGKGCLRFSSPAKIDHELLRRLLRSTAAAPGAVCGPLI